MGNWENLFGKRQLIVNYSMGSWRSVVRPSVVKPKKSKFKTLVIVHNEPICNTTNPSL